MRHCALTGSQGCNKRQCRHHPPCHLMICMQSPCSLQPSVLLLALKKSISTWDVVPLCQYPFSYPGYTYVQRHLNGIILKHVTQLMCCSQLDIPALYRREGDAPVRALQAALAASAEPGADANGISTEPAEGAPPADAAALRSALGGLVWTPSLRRMYTLLDRCRYGTVSSMHGNEHTLLHATNALGSLV